MRGRQALPTYVLAKLFPARLQFFPAVVYPLAIDLENQITCILHVGVRFELA